MLQKMSSEGILSGGAIQEGVVAELALRQHRFSVELI